MCVKDDLLALIESFYLKDKKELFWMDKNLNGWNQSWWFSGFSSWSVVFFIYINDLSDNLESNVKFFEDDTLVLSVFRDPINTTQKLNNDLDKVSLWDNKWKMSSIQIHLNQLRR